MMATEWLNLVQAYLHDPPDKAIDIRNHVSRARRYAEAATGDQVTEADLKPHADALAAAIERLPMPPGENEQTWVGLTEPEFGNLAPIHPLSAETHAPLPALALDEAAVEQEIRRIVDELPGSATVSHRFLALWRLLQPRLAAQNTAYALLPADTRVPDHTLTQHNDITAALAATGWGENTAFLSFSVGPVQGFIASARTVRDLWTGSMILSWLVFRAMVPILEKLGPTAFVYPSLRGVPLIDLWLQRKLLRDDNRPVDAPELRHDDLSRKSPCLPNRFVAVVPWGENGSDAIELAERVRESAQSGWYELCRTVHERLAAEWRGNIDAELLTNWDSLWNSQIENYFDFRTSVLPWKDCDDGCLARLLRGANSTDEQSARNAFANVFQDANAVRELARSIPSGFQNQDHHGQWQYRLELSARLLEAAKGVRPVAPGWTGDLAAEVPAKCSLLGSYEQMGPASLQQSAEFWTQAAKWPIGGVHLRSQERFSAIALVKRFAGPAFFRKELGFDTKSKHALRWNDTATIAAECWLQRASDGGIPLDPDKIRQEFGEWSGQWLHSTSDMVDDESPFPKEVREWIRAASRPERFGPPPAYYAILMLDGDKLGDWLRGDRSPRVHEVMHPKMRKWYADLVQRSNTEVGAKIRAGLDARRPVGPALHAAISEALANFSLHFVPQIVTKHQGTLIYAGGDDVLALLPTETALACVREIQQTYQSNWKVDSTGRERLLMGNRATVSAGLAVVHYKEDLRFALEQARNAEKQAKSSGRDALQLAVCRRSGEHASALCPWDFLPTVSQWVEGFLPQGKTPGASDRWAYHLRQELPTLEKIDQEELLLAELGRQFGRAEDLTRERLFGTREKTAAVEMLKEQFKRYRASPCPQSSAKTDDPKLRFDSSAVAFEGFLTLVQSASFLARGRDQ